MKDIDSDYMHVLDEFNDKVKEKAQIVYDKMSLLGFDTYKGYVTIEKEAHLAVPEFYAGVHKDLHATYYGEYKTHPASYEKKLSFLKESDSIIKELNNIIKARMVEMTNAYE